MRRIGGLAVALALVIVLPMDLQAAQPRAQANNPLTKTYAYSGTLEGLLTSNDATFNAFAEKVRDDLNWITDTRIITDRSALRAILSVRLAMEVLSGHEDSAALFTVTQIRNLEDKSDARQTTGYEIEALLKARLQTGEEEGPDVARAYRRILRADIEALPSAIGAEEVRALNFVFRASTSGESKPACNSVNPLSSCTKSGKRAACSGLRGRRSPCVGAPFRSKAMPCGPASANGAGSV